MRNEHQVLIAGGGPTGLMLAAELALAGVDVAIIERRASQELVETRARGLHARTIEVLDQRGIAERFLEAGYTAQVAGFAGVTLDISDFPTRHPYGLALVQRHVERILLEWAEELGVPIRRGLEVRNFRQDDAGVNVELDSGEALRAQYLVGCDGGRSIVRKLAGIAFPGWEASISHLIGEAEFAVAPPLGMRNGARGLHGLNPTEEDKIGILLTEARIGRGDEPTLGDLSAALIEAYGTDFGVHSPVYISRFTDMARQAERYRSGRVLLAGDAAHVHYPAGGQGLNLGIQDAVNLGWKLAQVVAGTSPEDLLDTYEAERHPVAARVLRNSMAAVAVGRADDRSAALRGLVAELLQMEEPRKRIAGMMSGLDIHYDLGAGHPLLGRGMPDLEFGTEEGQVRTYRLLHDARPMLIDFGGAAAIAVDGWADRVRPVAAAYSGPWELPVIGMVPAPAAVLVRPDGHVAWVGDGTSAGLREALSKWFGPPVE